MVIRYVLLFALASVFMLWMFPLVPAAEDPTPIPVELHAGTKEDPWPIYNSSTVSVGFDNQYKESKIVRTDVRIYNDAEPPVLVKTIEFTDPNGEHFVQTAERWKIPIRAYVEELPDGLYYFQAQVWDEHSNVSEWSTPCWGRKKWVILPPPSSDGGGCVIFR